MRGIVAPDDLADARLGGLRVAPVITQGRLQADQLGEARPEALLQGCCGEEALIGGRVDLKTRRAAGQELAARTGPAARGKTLAERPPHEREQMVGHGDVEVTAVPSDVALTQRQQDVERGGIAAARDVCDQRRRHHRRAVRTRRQLQQTGLGDVVEVVRREL